ncbi:MAG: phosphotransferase [Alphaproteobacteria bacterium]|nr:phosphotransferase [Alphaproteobacteria bacterium]
MNLNKARRVLVNIICGFIPGKARRKQVRAYLNSDIWRYKRFIRHDLGVALYNVHIKYGYGTKNIIILVNNKWAYKFPVGNMNINALANRELRIVKAMKAISPIHIPDMQIVDMGGVCVRKYEYIAGKTFGELKRNEILENWDNFSDKIAEFMYVIAKSAPDEIADLVPDNAKPRAIMNGWCHTDICGNFIVDSNTMQIISVIDWEDFKYGDFSKIFTSSLDLGTDFMQMVRTKYLNLCDRDKK